MVVSVAIAAGPVSAADEVPAMPSNYLALAVDDSGTIIRPCAPSDEDKFRSLADEWYRDRPRGDLHLMCAHPAYLRVIAMGPIAVPLIIAELRRHPEHWFTALSLLTDARDVVPPESRGRLQGMADAWIRWYARR